MTKTPNRRNWLKKAGMLMAGIGLARTGIMAAAIMGKPAGKAESLINPLTLNDKNMQLGAFSVSLTVKDLAVSKQFYENLGFTVLGGAMASRYLIMKNGNALVGLFQGMFEKNILTFNPGWDEQAQPLAEFTDVRKIQQHLKTKGVKIDAETDEKTTGPASIVLTDPDGNTILVDQHR